MAFTFGHLRDNARSVLVTLYWHVVVYLIQPRCLSSHSSRIGRNGPASAGPFQELRCETAMRRVGIEPTT